MKKNKQKKAGALLLLLIFLLQACNLPSGAEPKLSIEAQAGTLAAQTVTASQAQRPTQTPRPLNTPTQARPSKTPTKLSPSSTPTPMITETPTQTPSVPKAPGLENYDYYCEWTGSGINLTITITWTDKSNNEQGFIVRRDNEKIANLLPGSTSYFDAYTVLTGQVVNYTIQAYNSYGVSSQATVSVSCE